MSPNDFHDLTEIENRLRAFELRYNDAASPFDWKFTTHDLTDLLERLEQTEQTPTDQHRAA